MQHIKQKAREMFDERFAPNGFIEEDEELVVPEIKSFIDQIIDMVTEQKNCIECGELVGEHEIIKNCHGSCRVEI